MLSRRIGVLLAEGCPDSEAHLWAKIGRQIEKMERKLVTLGGGTDYRVQGTRASRMLAERLEPADKGRQACRDANDRTLRDLP